MRSFCVALLVVMLGVFSAWASPVTVVHQGQLLSSGTPVDGAVDMRFTLFDAAVGGAAVGGTVEVLAVPVVGGLYTAEVVLDSGLFTGVPLWFEIEAATGGTGSWFTLSPRQRVGVTPEAAHAVDADQAARADYALSGPFAPADLAPQSLSGVPHGTVFTATLTVGTQQGPVVLVGSVLMGYDIVLDRNMNPMPGSAPRGPVIRLRRNLSDLRVSEWYRALMDPASFQISLELKTAIPQVSHHHGWTFRSGVIVEYEVVAGSDGGAYEEILVLFPPADVTRESIGQPTGLRAPTWGGLTNPGGFPANGVLAFFVNTNAIGLTAVNLAMRVVRPYDLSLGGPTGVPISQPILVRRSSLGDNTMFEYYNARIRQPMEVDMEISGATAWQIFQADGLVYQIELRTVGDGYLVEDYSIFFGPLLVQ